MAGSTAVKTTASTIAVPARTPWTAPAIGAFTDLGTVGSFSSNTSAASVVVPLTVAVPVGATLVAFFGQAGASSTTTIADTQGNTYALGGSIRGNSSIGYIGIAKIGTALAVGNTVTMTNSQSGNGRCGILRAFTGLDNALVNSTLSASATGTTFTAAVPAPEVDSLMLMISYAVNGTFTAISSPGSVTDTGSLTIGLGTLRTWYAAIPANTSASFNTSYSVSPSNNTHYTTTVRRK